LTDRQVICIAAQHNYLNIAQIGRQMA